ncbi:MAG: Hsp33 family molecular chaperone HslO [Candidatus Paracaedibacter sp.]
MDAISDFVLPFQLEKVAIRGRLVRLDQSMQDILGRHQYPPLINRLLQELIALSAALANLFKFEGIFTLQINGDGPVRLLVVDITHEGNIRACARYDEEKVMKLPLSTATIHPILGTGYMSFTIDQNNIDDRYQGIVELSGSTLSECLHHFFRQSDQLETGVVAFSNSESLQISNPQASTHVAAALIIQRMPTSSSLSFEAIEEQNDGWLRSLSILGTVTAKELLSHDLSAQDLLSRLFWEDGIRVFENRFVKAKCRCSEDRISQMLQTFSTADIQEMIENEKITVTCEFCNQEYILDPQILLK